MVKWNDQGLVPVAVQEESSGRLLMLAWMNREALCLTVRESIAVYWSRSRQRLWRKGETSGHIQHVRSILLDCDSDTVLLFVAQEGGIACHTGRHSCFYRRLVGGEEWQEFEKPLKSPTAIYRA